jgi:hypothetical protein
MREGKKVMYNTNGGLNKLSPEAKAVATHSFKDMLKKVDEVIEVKLDLINDIALVDDDFNDMYLALRDMAINIRNVIKIQHRIDNKQEEDNLWKAMMEFRDPKVQMELNKEKNKDKINAKDDLVKEHV